MKIRKIKAPDMQQALLQIRTELGEDAVIISTAREPVKSIRHLFSRRNIEVTAAVDDVPVEASRVVPLPEQTRPLPPVEGTVRTKAVIAGNPFEAVPRRVIPGRIVPARLPEPILQIADEGENSWFKTLLLRELDKEETGLAEDVMTRWRKVLSRVEVDDSVVEMLLGECSTDFEHTNLPSDELIRVCLKNRIINLLKPAYENNNGARINTFIGPTGVGKTMTLVKLATRCKVVEKKQIALIAVYNHRFGAMEKLNYYGNIIGAPVEVVMTPAELARAVEAHRDKDVVFIDTEGRPSMNRSQVLELHSFMGAVTEPQNMYLVLSTPTKNRDLLRIAGDFQPVGYNRIVMTKIDETDTYGTMLNLVCNTGIPVGYVTNGQNVPDDIERFSPRRLAEIILGSVVPDEDYQT